MFQRLGLMPEQVSGALTCARCGTRLPPAWWFCVECERHLPLAQAEPGPAPRCPGCDRTMTLEERACPVCSLAPAAPPPGAASEGRPAGAGPARPLVLGRRLPGHLIAVLVYAVLTLLVLWLLGVGQPGGVDSTPLPPGAGLSSAPPHTIQNLGLWPDGQGGVIAYFSLADAQGAHTTADGVATLAVEGAIILNTAGDRDTLYLRVQQVTRADFQQCRVGAGILARSFPCYRFPRFLVRNYIRQTASSYGNVRVLFSPAGSLSGGDMRAETYTAIR